MSNLNITKRILIIEDSLGVTRALKRALSLPQGGGYWVDCCDSGEVALERIPKAHYDLLISDLRLPGIDGLKVLESAYQVSPETRSILITAFGSPQLEEQARHLANAYVPKPFRLYDIIRIVRRVINDPVDIRQVSLGEKTECQAIGELEPDVRRSTHLSVLACDWEGTLARDGQVSAETWALLRRAKTAGLTLFLVTGSRLSNFINAGPYVELFEAIVAENGAVVYFCRRDKEVQPFGRLATRVLQQLEALDVPLEHGSVILSIHAPHDRAVLDVLCQTGGGLTLEYNRGALMLLPPGATKGAGLRYALQELGFSEHNVVACGEAENDRSLFEVAEFAVALPSALPEMQDLADIVLPQTDKPAIQPLLADLLAGRVPRHQPRPSRLLALGHDVAKTPVYLDSFSLIQGNLGVFGASGSGKSWLAGLVVEQLLNQKYQVCIIDPEGDYRGLGTGPHSLLLGGAETQLPSVADVVNFFESSRVSLVLDLSVYTRLERTLYVSDLLRALLGLRARRGRPHWFLVDEMQSFCPPEGGRLTELFLEAMQVGGVGAVSYRPSQVSPVVLQALDHWLLTRLNLPEEIQTLEALFSGREQSLEQLPTLPQGQAYLYLKDPGEFVKFRVGERRVRHVRHRHKYLRAPLPESKRFYFHDASSRYVGRSAASLWEFREALGELSLDVIEHHLHRKDFERWVEGVLHDDELARCMRKLESRNLHGEMLRLELLKLVAERYEELDSLA